MAVVGVILLGVGQSKATALQEDLDGAQTAGPGVLLYPGLKQAEVADRASSADTFTGVGGALFGVGLAAAAIGGVLLLRGGSSSRASDRLSFGVAPVSDRGDGGMVWLRGTFGGL
jgi:hypothetical protein